MEGQDKTENMFQALEINLESRPYFPHLMFYVCLAIIKKNTYDATTGSLISERILTLPKKGTKSLNRKFEYGNVHKGCPIWG